MRHLPWSRSVSILAAAFWLTSSSAISSPKCFLPELGTLGMSPNGHYALEVEFDITSASRSCRIFDTRSKRVVSGSFECSSDDNIAAILAKYDIVQAEQLNKLAQSTIFTETASSLPVDGTKFTLLVPGFVQKTSNAFVYGHLDFMLIVVTKETEARCDELQSFDVVIRIPSTHLKKMSQKMLQKRFDDAYRIATPYNHYF